MERDVRAEIEERVSDVGEFIRAQREVARMSVRRLADLAGVSNPYLSQIERGLRKPSAEILQQLARALRVPIETLYVRAGILTDDAKSPPHDVSEAIHADPSLNDSQREALLTLYRTFVAQNGGESPAASGR